MERRAFLRLLAVGVAAGMAPYARAAPAGGAGREGRWLRAFGDRDGHFGVALLGGEGATRMRVRLAGRAHAVAVAPDRRTAVAVARRPGTWAAVVGMDGGPRGTFQAGPGRHFYGHGIFSPDGALFYTTENDYEGERGVIGVRSVAEGFRPIAEWPSGGIGPHELALGADGRTLVVANGGVLTHPDSGRAKLNVASMKPSLARLDLGSGRLVDRAELAPRLSPLSIRHVTVSPDDDVAFGLQDEGLWDPRAPLVGAWRRSGRIDLVAPGAPSRQRYIGSVALDGSGAVAAASAPRDGWIGFWELASGRWLGEVPAPDGCGVAPCPRPRAFRLSKGTGALLDVEIAGGQVASRTLAASDVQWDNHLTLVG
jgi:uncharacterized protein